MAFIDTEGTFRPDRIRPIAERFNLDPNIVLGNLVYARAHNHEHQLELINLAAGQFHQEPGVFRVLIVDSIIGAFSFLFKCQLYPV